MKRGKGSISKFSAGGILCLLSLPRWLIAEPIEVTSHPPRSVYQGLWSELRLEVTHDLEARPMAVEFGLASGIEIGEIRSRALNQVNGRHKMEFLAPFRASRKGANFGQATLLYRWGTETLPIRRDFTVPPLAIFPWINYFFAVLGGGFFLGLVLVARRRRTSPAVEGSPPYRFSELERERLSACLLREEWGTFLAGVQKVERETGIPFPLSGEGRERLQYGGDGELGRDLPRLWHKFLRELENREKELENNGA